MIIFASDEHSVQIQQVLSGSGVFDGTLLGYATYVYSSGGVVFTVLVKQFGAAGNNFNIALIDLGKLTPNCACSYDPVTNTLNVFLKRSSSVITAQASDVVNAINAYKFGTGTDTQALINDANALVAQFVNDSPFSADVQTDGTVAAVASTPFTGGLSPVVTQPNVYKYTPAGNVHGGLFYFHQTRPWYISSINGRFSTTGIAMSVRIVNVDKSLTPVPNQEVGVWEPTTSDIYASLEDMKTPLMPGQAILVNAPAQGLVRISARPEAKQSYL